MRYKTVNDVIDFVTELRAKDSADAQLNICVEFYSDGMLVGELDRNMCSTYATTTLKSISLLSYLVYGFKIEIREYCIAFVLNIKETSSIQY